MLETYGAETISLGFTRPKPNYELFYETAINDISAKINNRKV